ncbi:hypothetical protein [Luteococcus sp.]|uniref:hypothetical protein n=1 Tax=Luteococcus sp. TaxID=1969402 RepID=UPI003735EF9C
MGELVVVAAPATALGQEYGQGVVDLVVAEPWRGCWGRGAVQVGALGQELLQLGLAEAEQRRSLSYWGAGVLGGPCERAASFLVFLRVALPVACGAQCGAAVDDLRDPVMAQPVAARDLLR